MGKNLEGVLKATPKFVSELRGLPSPDSQTMVVIATVPILFIYWLAWIPNIVSLSYGTKGTELIFLFFFQSPKHLLYARHWVTGIELYKDTPQDCISAWDFLVNVVLDVSREMGSHRRSSRKCPGTRLLTTGDGDKIVAHRAAPFEFGLVWLTYFSTFHIISRFPVSWKKNVFHFGSE